MKISISGKGAAAVLLPPAGSPSLVLPNLFIGYIYYVRYRHSVISTSCRYSISYFVDNETLYSDIICKYIVIYMLTLVSTLLRVSLLLVSISSHDHSKAE